MVHELTNPYHACNVPHTSGGGFWAWAGVRLTAGGFMAGYPASHIPS